MSYIREYILRDKTMKLTLLKLMTNLVIPIEESFHLKKHNVNKYRGNF